MTHGPGLSNQATGCRIMVDLNDHGGAGVPGKRNERVREQ